jgi:hypothetical protein
MPPRHSRRTYDEIWRAVLSPGERRAMSRDTGYSQAELRQAHLELFLSLPGMIEEDRDIRYNLFGEYVNVMIAGGHTKEQRNRWFATQGLSPRDFDWQHWREVMGYRRRD